MKFFRFQLDALSIHKIKVSTLVVNILEHSPESAFLPLPIVCLLGLFCLRRFLWDGDSLFQPFHFADLRFAKAVGADGVH
jgi:hypothetical protein